MSHRITRDLDNVYLNLLIQGNQPTYPVPYNILTPSKGSGTIQAAYDATLNVPLVARASDYYLSIIRFAVPQNTIPITICEIIPNQANPLLTPYILGISYQGIDYPANVIFSSQSSSLIPPIQNVPNEQVITPYYYIYSYTNLLQMFNYALLKAYTDAGLTPIPSPPAFFYLDSGTQLIHLVVPPSFAGVDNPINSIPYIYFNTAMLRFLDGFPLFNFGTDMPNGKDYKISLTNSNIFPFPPYGNDYKFNNPTVNNNYVPESVVPAVLYYNIPQDFSTLTYWNSVSKILFTSNTLGTLGEVDPGTNGVSTSLPILTDFDVQLENGTNSHETVYYTPSSQYRLVDLTTNDAIQRIDLKVFWQDTNANIYPLELEPFSSISVKIAFLNKKLYKPMNQLLMK